MLIINKVEQSKWRGRANESAENNLLADKRSPQEKNIWSYPYIPVVYNFTSSIFCLFV